MRICSRSLLNNQELSQFVPPTMLLGRDGNRIFEEQVFCLLESRYISLSVMSLTVNQSSIYNFLSTHEYSFIDRIGHIDWCHNFMIKSQLQLNKFLYPFFIDCIEPSKMRKTTKILFLSLCKGNYAGGSGKQSIQICNNLPKVIARENLKNSKNYIFIFTNLINSVGKMHG